MMDERQSSEEGEIILWNREWKQDMAFCIDKVSKDFKRIIENAKDVVESISCPD